MWFSNLHFQMHSILNKIPTSRQTLLFSATIPPVVERLSSCYLTSPAFISVGLPSTPNMDVKQVILWVEDKSKKKRLFSLLNDSKYFFPPILVFVDSRIGADMLAEAIQKVENLSYAVYCAFRVLYKWLLSDVSRELLFDARGEITK